VALGEGSEMRGRLVQRGEDRAHGQPRGGLGLVILCRELGNTPHPMREG